jgi:hypothetical protein
MASRYVGTQNNLYGRLKHAKYINLSVLSFSLSQDFFHPAPLPLHLHIVPAVTKGKIKGLKPQDDRDRQKSIKERIMMTLVTQKRKQKRIKTFYEAEENLGYKFGDEYCRKNCIFWNITPCSMLKVSRCFGQTYRLHLRRISQVINQYGAGSKESSEYENKANSRNPMYFKCTLNNEYI